MSLFKEEKPYKTITLEDLYPESIEDIEINVGFDIFRAGQRRFKKNWFRIARQGHLPQAMIGEGSEEEAGNDFVRMLATPEGFNAGFELVAKGVVGDVHNFPSTNGDGQPIIVESLSGLPESERTSELRDLLGDSEEGESELLILLLMAALNAEAEYAQEIKDRAKKSSASSRAKREKRTPKSEG